MRKYLKHLGEILVGGLLIALFACINLNDYPLMRALDYIFWPMCLLFLSISLIYLWRHKNCLILGLLLLSFPVFAGQYTAEICSYKKSYEDRINAYRADHFKQDEACDEDIREKARIESEEYKTSLKDYIIPVYGAAKAAKNLISEVLSDSCASDLMALCSAYEKRHPETVTKTVPVLLNEAVGKGNENGRSISCWPCDMASIVFVVIQGLSNNLASMMSVIAFQALIWGTMFWLLFKATGMILTSKGGTYFAQISKGLLVVIVAAWFLKDGGQNLSWLYSKFLSPVMQVGLSIADDIQGSVGMDSPAFASMTGSSQPFYEQLESRSAAQVSSRTNFVDYCDYNLSDSDTESGSDSLSSIMNQVYSALQGRFSTLTNQANQNKTLLTDKLKGQFLCLTQKFYNQSRPFIATGQSLISFASHNSKTLTGFVTRFPSNFQMWVIGALLVGLFTYFGFLVAFRIMDIFLRLGFVLVLMPLFVVAAVFSVTRDYAVKAWNFLFHIIVEFIGLAISVSFVMILLEGVIMPRSTELLNAMTAPYTEDYGENLLKAITQNMTWTFPLLLICMVILGQRLLKTFPIIIAKLFDVPDSSGKGKEGTMMAATIGGVAAGAKKTFDSAKASAQTVAQNPYKTKETKAQEAEKELKDKEQKLKNEQKKPNNKKNIDKAQKDVDEARKKATALRAQADAEKEKTAPSQSGYAARRFGYDAGNAVRTGGASAAQAVDKFGSDVGGFLSKTGVGAIAGVPIVFGSKAVSLGIRLGAKTAEVGLKAAGRAGATAQKIGNKFTGKAPPPPKP